MIDDSRPEDLSAEDHLPEDRVESEESAALADALAREAELKDRLLRTLADLENLRRRAEKEKAESIQYGLTRFAGDLLAVADTLERALSSMNTETRDGASETVRTVLDGVDLTAKELLRVLEKHGIKRIDPKGARFDPHLHTAIAQVPAPTVPDGTVVDVAQAGYSIGDRLLRPAMVIVGTGGPKASNEPPPDAGKSVDTSA